MGESVWPREAVNGGKCLASRGCEWGKVSGLARL